MEHLIQQLEIRIKIYLGIEKEIYELILEIDTNLHQLNKNEFKADIYVPEDCNKKQWFKYSGGAIRNLLEKL